VRRRRRAESGWLPQDRITFYGACLGQDRFRNQDFVDRAAETTIATSPECSGEGSTYRVVARLWCRYFHPPRDTNNTSWYEKRDRPSKIVSGEAPLKYRSRRAIR
jgi:hypothetical protein